MYFRESLLPAQLLSGSPGPAGGPQTGCRRLREGRSTCLPGERIPSSLDRELTVLVDNEKGKDPGDRQVKEKVGALVPAESRGFYRRPIRYVSGRGKSQ